MRGDSFYSDSRRFAKFGSLPVPFIGLQFDLLYCVLKVGPFRRSNHLELKAELLLSAPPDNRSLNLNRGLSSIVMIWTSREAPGWTSMELSMRQPLVERSATRPSPPTMPTEENELRNLAGNRRFCRCSIIAPCETAGSYPFIFPIGRNSATFFVIPARSTDSTTSDIFL